MDLLALTCHTRGCLGWHLSLVPLRLEQHGPRRAPACSTQTCLIAYITIEQAKLSLRSEYSTWQHPYDSPHRATGKVEDLRLTLVHLPLKAAKSLWAWQCKTSGGCGQPHTLPKGEAQTHSVGGTKTFGGQVLLVWAGHRPALPTRPSTAQPPRTHKGERNWHNIPRSSSLLPTLWGWGAGGTDAPRRKQ